MWIKYIKLKNFENIHTGLKIHELSIDFTNRKNPIILLVGPNGIGKTSFLSCLTPFATLGNLDIRDSDDLIIPGREGYKRIIIMDKDDEYDIEHFYKPKENTHSTKSYIKLNGNELNTNGNVSSFKSIVNELLNIDIDYLKLIRIGDNVTNLVSMKAAERKSFMSKFLESVDIWLKWYKKFSQDLRDVKAIVSHASDKLQRLNISNVDSYEEDIKELRKELDKRQNEKYKVEGDINTRKDKLSGYDYDLLNNINGYIRDKEKKLVKWENKLKGNSNKSVEEIESAIKELEEELNKNESKSLTYKTLYSELLDNQDKAYKKLSDLNKELDKEISESNLDSLYNYLTSLHEKRKELESHELINLGVSKEEVSDFIVCIKNIQHALNITYEFGREPVSDAIELIKDNKSIKEFVASKLLAIESKSGINQKTYLDTLVDKYSKLKMPDCEDCLAVQLWKDIMLVKDLEPSEPKKLKSAEYYQMVQSTYDNIKLSLDELMCKEDVIKKLPKNIQEFFILKNLFKKISKCEIIYNDKDINELLMMVTEYSTYQDLLSEISKAQEEYRKEKERSKIEFLRWELAELDEDIEANETKLEGYVNEIDKCIEIKVKLNKELEDNKDLLDALTKFTSERDKYKELCQIDTEVNELRKDISVLREASNKLDKDINYLSFEIKQREVNLLEYDKLNKELSKAKEIYDDLTYIKMTTSSKEGVPLVYIEMYLKDVVELANELLDIVYNGDIYLLDFDIGSDTFLMPFVKDGKEIVDISHASQGEKGMLTMAISFAITAKNLRKYDIPLLDEVDATFDKEKRERFIDIIEKQRETIGYEQAFIISHNNMFQQYDVDVLDFTNLKDSIFKVETRR